MAFWPRASSGLRNCFFFLLLLLDDFALFRHTLPYFVILYPISSYFALFCHTFTISMKCVISRHYLTITSLSFHIVSFYIMPFYVVWFYILSFHISSSFHFILCHVILHCIISQFPNISEYFRIPLVSHSIPNISVPKYSFYKTLYCSRSGNVF